MLFPSDSATLGTSVNPKLALLRARVGDPRDGYSWVSRGLLDVEEATLKHSLSSSAGCNLSTRFLTTEANKVSKSPGEGANPIRLRADRLLATGSPKPPTFDARRRVLLDRYYPT